MSETPSNKFPFSIAADPSEVRSAMGHEHAFPRPRANGWCRFSQGTLPPGRVATGRGAPKSVMRIGTGQPRWLGAQTIRLPPASWFGCFCLRNAIGYCPGRRTRRCWPRKLSGNPADVG